MIQLRQDIEKRPRLLFHKVTANSFAEVRADFVVDLKPCWEVSKRRLEKELAGLKERALNELNNNLFNEIQEKYVSQKEKKKLSKIDVGAFEARCLIYSLMCGTIVSTWPQVASEIRAGLDTVAQMYQQIANISKYVHAEVADSFNMCCERVNVPSVKVQEGEEEEEICRLVTAWHVQGSGFHLQSHKEHEEGQMTLLSLPILPSTSGLFNEFLFPS